AEVRDHADIAGRHLHEWAGQADDHDDRADEPADQPSGEVRSAGRRAVALAIGDAATERQEDPEEAGRDDDENAGEHDEDIEHRKTRSSIAPSTDWADPRRVH